MSMDEETEEHEQQVLEEGEEEVLSTLGEQMERSYQQLDLDALRAAGELLRRETNSLKSASNIVEAQRRSEFLQRLSAIVMEACCKLEAKMHVSLS